MEIGPIRGKGKKLSQGVQITQYGWWESPGDTDKCIAQPATPYRAERPCLTGRIKSV